MTLRATRFALAAALALLVAPAGAQSPPTQPAGVQFLDVSPMRREDSLAPAPVCR